MVIKIKTSKFDYTRKKRTKPLIDYQRKLNYLRAYEKVPFASWKKISPQQKRWITINYKRVAQLSIGKLSEFKPIKNRNELKQLIAAGYRATKKGVVIPKVVSALGIPLLNQKREIDKRGRTITRVGNRRNIDIYFTPAERKLVAKNPEIVQTISERELQKIRIAKGSKTQLTLIYSGGLNRIIHTSARKWSISDSDRKNSKYIIGVRISIWSKKRKNKKRSKH